MIRTVTNVFRGTNTCDITPKPPAEKSTKSVSIQPSRMPACCDNRTNAPCSVLTHNMARSPTSNRTERRTMTGGVTDIKTSLNFFGLRPTSTQTTHVQYLHFGRLSDRLKPTTQTDNTRTGNCPYHPPIFTSPIHHPHHKHPPPPLPPPTSLLNYPAGRSRSPAPRSRPQKVPRVLRGLCQSRTPRSALVRGPCPRVFLGGLDDSPAGVAA